MAPPTLAGTYQSAVTSSSSSFGTISNIDVQNGDLVIVYGRTYDNGGGDYLPNNPDSSGTEPNWSSLGSVMISGLCSSRMWVGPITTTETISISLATASTVSSDVKSFTVYVWRNHGGLGVYGAFPTSYQVAMPSMTLNGVSANSAIVTGNSDWNAVSGTRTPITTSAGAYVEKHYHTGSDYVSYDGVHLDAGSAGNKSLGWTAPTGQRAAMLAVEILAGADAPPAVTATGRMFPFLTA